MGNNLISHGYHGTSSKPFVYGTVALLSFAVLMSICACHLSRLELQIIAECANLAEPDGNTTEEIIQETTKSHSDTLSGEDAMKVEQVTSTTVNSVDKSDDNGTTKGGLETGDDPEKDFNLPQQQETSRYSAEYQICYSTEGYRSKATVYLRIIMAQSILFILPFALVVCLSYCLAKTDKWIAMCRAGTIGVIGLNMPFCMVAAGQGLRSLENCYGSARMFNVALFFAFTFILLVIGLLLLCFSAYRERRSIHRSHRFY